MKRVQYDHEEREGGRFPGYGVGRRQESGAATGVRRSASAAFGSSLNLHTHFHVCVIDGVFESDPEHGVRFIEVKELDTLDAEAVKPQVRRRILRAYQRGGILDKEDRAEMELWYHGGGFSLDATVRIMADDRRGLERLLRYCARPPQRLRAARGAACSPADLPPAQPDPDGRAQLVLSPLERIARIAALAPSAVAAQPPPAEGSREQSAETPLRSPARCLWAMLLSRICEAPPPSGTCGTEMRIVAFITEASTVQRILSHIGEPAQPPKGCPGTKAPAVAGGRLQGHLSR